MKTINLALVAATHGVDPGTVIAPMQLALALHAKGVPVAQAAEQCGVARPALHAKLKKEEIKCDK